MDRLTDVRYWEEDWWRRKRPERLWLYRDFDFETVRLLHRAAGDGPARVIELGAGGSRVLPYLARKFGNRVFGADFSPSGCRLLRANLSLVGVTGGVVREDMFSSSLAPASFDLVFSSGLIEHFTDTPEAVAAHLRLVRPGGKLVLIVPNLSGVQGRIWERLAPPLWAKHKVFGPTDLEALLREAGLERTQSGYIGSFLVRVESGPDWTGMTRLPTHVRAAAASSTRIANGIISLGFRLSPWRPHSRSFSPAFFALGTAPPKG